MVLVNDQLIMDHLPIPSQSYSYNYNKIDFN